MSQRETEKNEQANCVKRSNMQITESRPFEFCISMTERAEQVSLTNHPVM